MGFRLYPYPTKFPRLLFADEKGKIYEHPYLWALGLSGYDLILPKKEDFIPVPQGSALYVLSHRYPIGLDPHKQIPIVLKENPWKPGSPAWAVACYLAPAHTQLFLCAYEEEKENLPPLPLFSYACVGWTEGKFWTTAFRSDFDPRQEIRFFSEKTIKKAALKKLKEFPQNRLVKHLVQNCIFRYKCPAAQNFVLSRWEAPIPTSPSCNARCLGCLSAQEKNGPPLAQERITFIPKPEEIAEAIGPHLNKATRAVVSFGQGCEGEPLLQARVLEESIKLLRQYTFRGTINLNTNASLPEAVERLCKAGLDSMRVSLVSGRPFYYKKYFRPQGYSLEEVKASISIMKRNHKFVSLNLFVFPGLTDEREEVEALKEIVSLGIDFIQLRNHALDPLWYLKKIDFVPSGETLGIKKLVDILSKKFPRLRFGYFNPPLR